jgi:hypothetical protein
VLGELRDGEIEHLRDGKGNDAVAVAISQSLQLSISRIRVTGFARAAKSPARAHAAQVVRNLCGWLAYYWRAAVAAKNSKTAGRGPTYREKAMNKPILILTGIAMLSIGASAASAQAPSTRAPQPKVESAQGRGDKGGREDRREDRHEDKGRGIGRDRVWVEDFEMVEERYQEEGRFEMRERKVWIEEQKVTVHETFMVPEKKIMVKERVLIPEQKVNVDVRVHVEGKWVESEEVRVLGGHRFTFRHINYVWEHDEMRRIEKCIPAHYEDVMIEKCIPAHEECREVVKCIPGHFETVCEKVFIEGCTKTRMVKKSTGGDFEVRARR